MPGKKYPEFRPVDPYFSLVRDSLGDLVEGEHFLDSVADDVVYEVRYEFPGWPRVLKGREALMDAFRSYGRHIEIHRADNLIRHVTHDGDTVVIEYDIEGRVLASGEIYRNRFCSVILLAGRRICGWRDYMDSLAAWKTLSGLDR